jgi:hypothetical protein
MKDNILWKNGQPCNHKGCLSHITHPCEGCGRIAGKGNAYIPLTLTEILSKNLRKDTKTISFRKGY